MKKNQVFLLVCMLILTAAPAAAGNDTVTVSFSDLNLMQHADVQIYRAENSTLLGTWNTTSNNIALSPGSYMVVIKPTAVSRLTNPVTMLTDAVSFLETYWLQIFLAFALVVFIVRKW